MFRRFRRSVIGAGSVPPGDVASQQVCHECGQTLPVRNTNNNTLLAAEPPHADQAPAGRYSAARGGKHDSWNGSVGSDSGYGSSPQSEFEAQLGPGQDEPPAAPARLPRRRSTCDSSIYSEASTPERAREVAGEEPAAAQAAYDHLFSLPPRTLTSYSDRWKPRAAAAAAAATSRYSRLNELPAASPTAAAFPDDAMAAQEHGRDKEPGSPDKKRKSLALRPGSLRRLASRRLRSQ